MRFKLLCPPGYVGTRVGVLEYEDKLGIYRPENLLIEHPYPISIDKITGKKTTRKIAAKGNIVYLSGGILLYQ